MSPERFKVEIDKLVQWVRNDALEDAVLVIEREFEGERWIEAPRWRIVGIIRSLIKPL